MNWHDHAIALLNEAGLAQASSRAPPRWHRIGGTARDAHWSLVLGPARHFVKSVAIADRSVLEAERDALQAIAATGSVRVPSVAVCGSAVDTAFLVLEWLDIARSGGGAALGRALAALHGATAPRFGWPGDNTIGLSPQRNGWMDDWCAFFRERRLRVQLDMAVRKGYGDAFSRTGAAVLDRVDELLGEHRPRASLLHGDLWSGNAARLRDGSAAVFDPSAYYGDRETDVAMTRLFGGFDPSFYAAYEEALPLPAGHAARVPLYNFYHVLNHLNLFGAGYLPEAQRIVATLLRR
jgi:fructosamine-3-kinase